MHTVDVNSQLALPGQPAAAGDSIQDQEVKYQLARHVGDLFAGWHQIRHVEEEPPPDEEDDEQEGARVTWGFSSLCWQRRPYSTTRHRPYLIQERLITC